MNVFAKKDIIRNLMEVVNIVIQKFSMIRIIMIFKRKKLEPVMKNLVLLMKITTIEKAMSQ